MVDAPSGAGEALGERNILFNQEIDQDDCWKVIDSYFKKNGLVTQQLSSFERFLKYEV